MIVFSGLFFILSAASVASAQEGIAAFPPLPSGYTSIKVFDRQGRFAGRILPAKRYWVSIDRIPVFLQNALVAVEDARFYTHGGIDIRGIARALVKDVIKGRMAEGGSTITQQLIKNKYFHGEKTIRRKIEEGFLAIEYERKYTKKQILEMYFNEVYFGNGAWGIAQAARIYFDKMPQELNDAECSLLAGVPKAPSVYNPLGDSSKLGQRRNLILKRMADLKMITPRQAQKLRAFRISVMKPGEAPYYLDYVRNKLTEQYGPDIIEQGGLEVITGMDLDLQRRAEKVLSEGVRHISPLLQGALLSMDTQTGDILAAVGGTSFAQSPYDRAFLARRQPGSAIKPLIYAAALEKGITPSTIWNDTPVAYPGANHETWEPLNYDRKRYGDLTLRQALAHSNNVIAVKLLDAIGVPYFVNFAGTLGLSLRSPNDLSLALGTEEVTLKDLMSVYAPLANGGLRSEPRSILRIYERGQNVWKDHPQTVTQVLAPATAFVTTQMMKDVLTYGTAKSLKDFTRQYPAAGKTGTTDDYRDAWFIGYTPQIITGVWIGYDKPRPVGKGFTGGAVCAPIWERFMRTALAGKSAEDFHKPDTVVSVLIDPQTGLVATPNCPHQREEFYLMGTQPTRYCEKHGGTGFVLPTPAPSLPSPGVDPFLSDPGPAVPIPDSGTEK